MVSIALRRNCIVDVFLSYHVSRNSVLKRPLCATFAVILGAVRNSEAAVPVFGERNETEKLGARFSTAFTEANSPGTVRPINNRQLLKQSVRAVSSGCSGDLASRKLAKCENTMTLEHYWHFNHTVRSPETGPSTGLNKLKMRAREARQRSSVVCAPPLLYMPTCHLHRTTAFRNLTRRVKFWLPHICSLVRAASRARQPTFF